MTAPLPLMTEDEVRRAAVTDEERGFGCMRTERGTLPLKALDVEARVIGTFAHTTVRQVFVNTLGVPMEATYVFPLPDRAAVSRFTLEVAGRKIEGILEERGQARRNYDAAIAAGKRASIAEEERPGVFTIRAGNLMPGEAAAITLELSGALPIADGEVTYRFPLVVAPRYMPGQLLGGEDVGDGTARDTDAVPDASRISPPVLLPGFSSMVRLGIAVELDGAGLPLSEVRSSLHAAYADEKNGRLAVRIGQGERLDRDFILRFRLGDGAVRTSARVVRDGNESVFAVTLMPPVMNIEARPKEVVFVLDRSGSMEGWKMVAARRATARMIDSLRAADRFQVLAFDTDVECLPLSDGLVEASDRNRFRAAEWLAKVDARGGTEMAEPLERAAKLLAGGYLERDRVLVFVTDGQVGNEAQLLNVLGQRLKGTRVFALGIDQAVNGAFLNRLAGLGRSGEAELIESEDRLDEVLQRLHRRVGAPVIAELSVDVDGGQIVSGTLAPQQLPDVFPGVPAVFCGRVSGSARSFRVRGRLADGARFEQVVPAVEVSNPVVRAAWARLHLRDLEDRMDAGQGDRADLARRIVDVSLKNTVLCRFTAFVAVDAEVVNRGGRQQKLVQAVEQPAGWGGAASAAAAPSAARMRSGAPAAQAPAPMLKAAAAQAPSAPLDLGRHLEALDDASASFDEEPDAFLSAPAEDEERASMSSAPRSDWEESTGSIGAKSESIAASKGASVHLEDANAMGAFLPRVVEIVELIELARGRSSDAASVAVELKVRLLLLLEDMAHAGVSADERRPFEDALRLLEAALTRGEAAAAEQALAEVDRLLQRAAGPAQGASAASRRSGFWR